METIKKYSFLILLLSWYSTTMMAQSDLEIRKVFEEYGNKKGVVMVELKGKMLEDYDFTAFKSISITNQTDAGDFIRKCLAKDEIGAKKVKQVVSSGKATSIILQLAPKNESNRLILFNESSGNPPKITLIYIESDSESDDVLKLVLRKK
jgi:hypothetical protein